jgi:DNA-binding MarR family transcriptional regulator
MGKVLDEYRAKLKARLQELQPAVDEYDEIKGMLAAFESGAQSQTKSRRRVPLPERENQVVTLVKENPGITAKELAGRLGVSSARIVQVVNELEKKGRVERREGGVKAK